MRNTSDTVRCCLRVGSLSSLFSPAVRVSVWVFSIVLARVRTTLLKPIVKAESATLVTNQDAWRTRYATTTTTTNADGTPRVVGGWASHNLKAKVSAFVDGGGNFLASLGIPLKMGIAIMAVLVASFAATTLDTATRLQRYVISELAQTANIKPLMNRYIATAFALVLAAAVALLQGPSGPGSGGMTLWPLFGATNQLLAGLAFMVIVFLPYPSE